MYAEGDTSEPGKEQAKSILENLVKIVNLVKHETD